VPDLIASERRSRSERHSSRQVVYRDLCVAKDLPEQTGTESLAGMNRDGRYPTVLVAQSIMTASDASNLEPVIDQDADKVFACDPGELWHFIWAAWERTGPY
jgi:hypothetical protein